MTKDFHNCSSCTTNCIKKETCLKCGDMIEEGFPHRASSDKGKCIIDKEDF